MAHDILHPTWIDRSAFPFAAHSFHHPEGRLHYVDEGSGPVILFVHEEAAERLTEAMRQFFQGNPSDQGS